MVAVSRHRTFSAAADELGVAASALSETIKQIEADTGIQLFDRTVRPPAITEFGERFAKDAERILAQFGQAVQDMRDLGSVKTGTVRIAAAPSMMCAIVIPAIERFHRSNPGVKVIAHQENAEIVEKMLLAGDVDIGLHELWEKVGELEFEPFIADRYGLACSQSHELAERTSLTLDDVSGHTFISLAEETGIRKHLELNLSTHPNIWDSSIETSNTIAMIWMLSRNLGVALAPELSITIPSENSLRFIPIEGVDFRREIFLMIRSNRSATPSAQAFAEVLREVGRDVSARLTGAESTD